MDTAPQLAAPMFGVYTSFINDFKAPILKLLQYPPFILYTPPKNDMNKCF